MRTHCHIMTLSPKKAFIKTKSFFPAAAPVTFKKELESCEAKEGDEVTLTCETSSVDCKVTWLRGSTVLTEGNKYRMEQIANTHTLAIRKLDVSDSGEYTCDTGDKRTSASVTVKGNKHLLVPLVIRVGLVITGNHRS